MARNGSDFLPFVAHISPTFQVQKLTQMVKMGQKFGGARPTSQGHISKYPKPFPAIVVSRPSHSTQHLQIFIVSREAFSAELCTFHCFLNAFHFFFHFGASFSVFPFHQADTAQALGLAELGRGAIVSARFPYPRESESLRPICVHLCNIGLKCQRCFVLSDWDRCMRLYMSVYVCAREKRRRRGGEKGKKDAEQNCNANSS